MPAGFNNNRNGVPSYLAGQVNGAGRGTGKVESGRVLTHNILSLFWTGTLRSPPRLQNTFAHESFLKEIGARVDVQQETARSW